MAPDTAHHRRHGRTAAFASSVVALLGALLLTASPASAEDGRVVHVEHERVGDQGVYTVAVDVPAGTTVDLGDVTATVNGHPYRTTAQRVSESSVGLRRTAVLAIDTSESMTGDRFEAARSAAETYLDSVPADVRVGIVTFDAEVSTALLPTTDRDAARTVLDGLSLHQGTRLYDGVTEAVGVAAATGQGSVLVLSDGADTSSTSLDSTVTRIGGTGVLVDVVALDQTGESPTLQRIAGDEGTVISAGTENLGAVFAAEAESLGRQLLVTVTTPPKIGMAQSTVGISLPTASDGAVLVSSTVPGFAAPKATGGGADTATVPRETAAAPTGVGGLPGWVVYVVVGVFGLALLAVLVLLVPRGARAETAEQRINAFAAQAGGPVKATKEQDEAPLKQASEAMAQLLERNRGMEARIARRLEAAGSQLKASEWLLLHAAIVLGAVLLGLLLGGGNLVVALLVVLAGAFGPQVYLKLKASKRRKRFNSQLPETLQLMSGSLTAGLSLLQSVDTVVREGPEPVASEFRRAVVETRIGVSLEDALDGIGERFESKDFRWVVMAIRIQRQVGGNLAELLDTVAGTMREREYIRRQVAALAAEGKLSAIVLGGLPPGFLLYLLVGNRDYVMPIFSDPRGIVMLLGAGLWLGIGIFWMSRMVKVEV